MDEEHDEQVDNHIQEVDEPLEIDGLNEYTTVFENNSDIVCSGNSGFLSVKFNRGNISILGAQMLVVVFVNEGSIELAGKNNELRVVSPGSLGVVNTSKGAKNKLNGLLIGASLTSKGVKSEKNIKRPSTS